MTKLKEKAAEYSFNIPSKIYQSCKTQEEMKLWKDEIEQAYICGHNQCFQDFMEKAEGAISMIIRYYVVEDYTCDQIWEEFKNYMQDESEN